MSGDGFAMAALGPWRDEDGERWCCGLLCGRPCPYKLKIRRQADDT